MEWYYPVVVSPSRFGQIYLYSQVWTSYPQSRSGVFVPPPRVGRLRRENETEVSVPIYPRPQTGTTSLVLALPVLCAL